MSAPLTPQREAEIRAWVGRLGENYNPDWHGPHSAMNDVLAELAALPAPVVETGILTADGGAWLLDKVDDDRRKLILQYTPAMQRIVRYGEWTEVTS